MSAWQIVVGLSIPVSTFFGAVVTAILARRGGREATRSVDWQGYMAEQREWTEDRLAERDRRIDSLESDVREMRTQLADRDKRIDRLERELDDLLAKYRGAVAYIRRLVSQLRQHVEREDIEPPPPEITPDL